MDITQQILEIYQPVALELNEVDKRLKSFGDDSPSYAKHIVQYAVSRPGKKVRPIITLLAASVFGEIGDHPIKMATATELLHLATLIHDDTIDNADLRRGSETISKKWGNHVAVLIGDYIFAMSAVLVCETGHTGVVKRFSETIMELSSGELREYFDIGNVLCSEASYLDRIYNKTASLFATATESGAILNNANLENSERLRLYGYNIGMGFQVMDDLLDVLGTSSELGKPAGNDLIQGVMTLPSILFVQKYQTDRNVKALLKNPQDPHILQQFADKIKNSDVIKECELRIKNYCNEAIAQCKDLPNGSGKEALNNLVGYLMERQR
jgi:octaprenyl-diphosphate synthase